MGVSYRPLWVELARREMSKIKFQQHVGISGNLLAKLGNNQYISMKNLERICRGLNLAPDQVIEFKEEGNGE